MKFYLSHFQLLSKQRLKLSSIVSPLINICRYKTDICSYHLVNIPKCIYSKNIHTTLSQDLQLTSRLTTKDFSTATFETISSETLDSLNERLEELIEHEQAPLDSDIAFSTGVITLKLGQHGTYVINKQTPNKQIWLSSPFSGPKRYDFLDNHWVYKHDNTLLHALLSQELSKVFNMKIDMSICKYGRD